MTTETDKEQPLVIGGYYEDEKGNILYTIGIHREKGVTFYYEGESSQTKPVSILKDWKIRRDLRDFPNAKDPRLPYDFDLLYDLKYLSQLKKILSDYEKIKKMAEEHNLI